MSDLTFTYTKLLTFSVRARIADDIQDMIESSEKQGASAEFIAGLETALAVITGSLDSRPEELKSAEA